MATASQGRHPAHFPVGHASLREYSVTPSCLIPSQISSTLDVASSTATLRSSRRCEIYPISSSMFGRYDKNVVIPKTCSQHIIEPFTMIYAHPSVPFGWNAMTHPEGGLYFFQEHRKIFTDAILYDPDVLELILDCICQLDEVVEMKKVILPPDTDLVLDLTCGEEGPLCGYYFVDHRHRSLFWLEEFDASSLLEEVKGISSLAHIGHEIESQYWMHWDLFPNTRCLSQELLSELREIVIHNIDSMTSSWSTAPYDTTTLKEMLNLVNNMSVGVESRAGHSGCIFGRLMATFAHQKFLHLHGESGARLNRDQTVYGNAPQPSLFMRNLSPVLFYAPNTHLKELTTLWVDELVCHVHWCSFLDKLITEWREFALYAALLLNVNVGLLAVGSGRTSLRSPAEIAGCVSLAASVCSILISLMLLRQYRTKNRGSAADAGAILSNNGLETLAIIYSLPYVCLMWGLVTFVLAISLMFYQKTDTLQRLLIGFPSLALGIAVFCSVWVAWDYQSTAGPHWLPRVWDLLRSRTNPGDGEPIRPEYRWTCSRPAWDSNSGDYLVAV